MFTETPLLLGGLRSVVIAPPVRRQFPRSGPSAFPVRGACWSQNRLYQVFRGVEAGYRFYDPNLQRWLSRDPIGEEGGINLYEFVNIEPIGFIDPDGLKSWLCKRALNKKPGTPPPNKGPLYHQYYCVQLPGSEEIECYGQTSKWPYGKGRPTTPEEDAYDPNTCTPIEGNDCFDRCLARKGKEKRPRYGLIGPFTNCQEWSNDAIAACHKECPPQCNSPFTANTFNARGSN